MSFVNLETGARTYIASLKVNPNFAPALDAGTRADRKSLAYNAMIDAEGAVKTTLLPKLDALKAQGLVTSFDFATGTGALILNVDDARAGAAFQALQGIDELGRIVRNREVKLDTVVQGETPAPPATPTKTVEWNVDKTNAQGAWAQGVTGEGIVVGIVDTGANVGHEALKGHYRGTQADGTFDDNYNFFDPVNNKTVAYDDHSHGSHVAGTSVGGTDDHLTGMAPGAKFISAKVFTAQGSGSTATILKGLSWMLAPTKSDGTAADPTKAPDIVSNSWGNSNGASLGYIDAWKAFEAAGIIPVVAAGNSGRPNTIGAPGSYPQSITVGATDINDKVASFSSRGPSKIKDADGNFINKPDISAPGKDIISAGKSGDQYVKMSGTSMATPAVSGMIALLLSKYPNLTGEQAREVLAQSAVDIDAPGYDLNTGHGRVDAVAILAKADELFGQKPPTA
jgi:bacillopeptidase F